jgi:hypothetical protein
MDAYVLTPNQIPPLDGPSSAKAEITANGNIESYDQMLEFNVLIINLGGRNMALLYDKFKFSCIIYKY